jgi:hypothetical protein
VVAFSFNSDLSFHEMIALSIFMGPWKWHERDSAWYYNLASVSEKSPSGKIKLHLIESGPNEVGAYVHAGGRGEARRYAVLLSVLPDHDVASNVDREWAAMRSIFLEVVLPVLGARDLQESDSIDA